MRLKTYTAPSITAAMAQIRRELGADAIIVATRSGRGGREAQVTAAVDSAPARPGRAPGTVLRTPPEPGPPSGVSACIAAALRGHGIRGPLAEELRATAATFAVEGPLLALSAALDTLVAFEPIIEVQQRRPLMLVGPPGAGKTLTAAKILTRARQAGCTAAAVTTDVQRAGAIAQIEAFTRILGVPLTAAAEAQALSLWRHQTGTQLAVIDTAGCNLFLDSDLAVLRALIDAADAEPVAVLPAGGDVEEAADMACALAGIGCRRLIVTRLDAARRLGVMVAAPEAAGLALAAAGISPHVAGGLSAVNPVSLARLLLPQTDDRPRHPHACEATR
jgi:flagellar biosynthesis protein FlhF